MFSLLGLLAPYILNGLNGPTVNVMTQTLGPGLVSGIRTTLVVSQYAGQYLDEGLKLVIEEFNQLNQK